MLMNPSQCTKPIQPQNSVMLPMLRKHRFLSNALLLKFFINAHLTTNLAQFQMRRLRGSDEETDIEGMSENDHRQPCSMVHRFSFWFYLTLTAGNRQRVSLGNPDDKDEDRNLLDVEVQEIDVVSLSRMQKH